jgi:hypothetical protein
MYDMLMLACMGLGVDPHLKCGFDRATFFRLDRQSDFRKVQCLGVQNVQWTKKLEKFVLI